MKMDSSAIQGFQQTCKEEIRQLQVNHEKNLALLAKLSEEEELELREAKESNLQLMKATVTSSQYQDIISPWAEDAFKYNLQQLEIRRKREVERCEKIYKKKCAEQEVAYQQKLRAELAQAEPPPPATTTESSGIPQHKDVSVGPDSSERNYQPMPLNSFESPNPVSWLELTKPLICTVQREVVDSKPRLMIHIKRQPKKRKASTSEPTDELAPKRPHLDTSLNTSANSLRTPVSTPVNEPRSSQQPERTITFEEVYQNGNAEYKHYIAEWPEHSKKWYIVKCEQHRQHFTLNPIPGAARHLNSASHGFPDRNRHSAIKALGYRVIDCDEIQVRMHNKIVEEAFENGYKPLGFRRPGNWKYQPKERLPMGVTESRAATFRSAQDKECTPEELPTESGQEGGITHPKTFHIYYGKWRVNGRKNGEFYPVMILGWDDQEGSGLKDTYLHNTNLLEKSSQPPSCYKYDSKKIIGWAPDYEDGGTKVWFRKFPVMFFDVEQTVAWFPASDLYKFPLYKRKAPPKHDHPFNAARRWIAEREGFKTWEDREKWRLNAFETRPQSSYSKTSAECVLKNTDSDDSEDSCSGSDTGSTVSTETERILKKLVERGGEISDDDDYSESAPDIIRNGIDGQEMDDNLDFEVEEWNNRATNTRPWAFYQLRGADGDRETGNAVQNPETHQAQELPEEQEVPSMTSEFTDSQTPHDKPTHDTNSQADITNVLRGDHDSRISPPRDREEGMSSTNDVVPEFSTSKHSEETLYTPEDGLNSVPVTPGGPIASDHLLGIIEQVLGEQALGKETTETRSSTTPYAEPPGLTSTTPVIFTNDVADAKSDYELSLFSNEVTSWERSDENEDGIRLFYSADRKTTATREGHINITVDPMEMIGFSREPIAGSDGNSVLTLKYKCGSTWRVIFDRNKQSKLGIGKTQDLGFIQNRNFIRWLRSVNPDIKRLGS